MDSELDGPSKIAFFRSRFWIFFFAKSTATCRRGGPVRAKAGWRQLAFGTSWQAQEIHKLLSLNFDKVFPFDLRAGNIGHAFSCDVIVV